MTNALEFRNVELEGGYNVRDIGGLQTSEGRQVRCGRVFRSASLADLTDGDRQALADLGIRLVIDLRSTREREHAPSRIGVKIWARDYDASQAELIRMLRKPSMGPDIAFDMMIKSYRGLHEEQADALREFLRCIATGETPLLIHCSVGKDRTGVAVAILLALLGVSPVSIMDDYLLTAASLERSRSDAKMSLAKHDLIVSDAVLAPIIGVEPAYLEAMFDALIETYGSVAQFAQSRLQLTSAELMAVRDAMLK